MSSAGIKDIKCNKLTSKEGKVFPTAAFFVSCLAGYKDAFYSEATWPLGCELRDWPTGYSRRNQQHKWPPHVPVFV